MQGAEGSLIAKQKAARGRQDASEDHMCGSSGLDFCLLNVLGMLDSSPFH